MTNFRGRDIHTSPEFCDISLFWPNFRIEIDGSYDVYRNSEELYSKYEWTKFVMTFDLLVGAAEQWVLRTGDQFTMFFTKYFWFVYILWISSSLYGASRRQAYV